MKTVLYVSGDTALWICFKRNVVVDCYQEPISINTQGTYTSCRWLDEKHATVHLLVDSEQAEIDAHPLLEVGSRWSYRSNKKALQQRLVERFPDAIVRTAASVSKIEAALVQHINLPENTRNWLRHLEASGITFCSIATVAELLADRLSAKTQAAVIVSVASDFIRHTYCRSGYALFTRAVAKANAQEHANQFTQTLEHLSVTSLIGKSVPVYVVGLSVSDVELLSDHALVSELIHVNRTSFPVTVANEVDSRYATELSIAALMLDGGLIGPKNPDRHVSYAIEKHQAHGLRQKKIRQGAMLAAIAFLSLGYSAFNELQRSGQQAKLLVRKAELSAVIDQYKDEANELSPKSVPLSTALLNRLAIESATGVSPAILLTVLAEAFTEYQTIELQELKWVVVDASDTAEDSEYQVMTHAVVTERDQLPRVDATPSITRVTLAGKIVKGDSLREQHNAFDALTSFLEQQSTVSNFTVIQSPPMQLDGAGQAVSNGSISKPVFQLQFDLLRTVNNEA